MRIATIDIGTNSTRLLICDVSDCAVNQILKLGRVTRLGRGVKRSGYLSREGMERTIETLKEFKALVQKYNVEKVVVATTEATRLAANAEEFLSRVRELGFEIEVLSDREEAELVFNANIKAFSPSDKAMTVDLGGGSTEVVYGDRETIHYLESLKFGVVTLYEEFIGTEPPKEEELQSMGGFIRKELMRVRSALPSLEFEAYAVGGTITSVVAMEERMTVYDPEKVHGYRVTRETIERWYRKLVSIPLSERRRIVGLEENRADVIVPGVAFFRVFCEVFEKESLTVSELGLLYGLALREAERCRKG